MQLGNFSISLAVKDIAASQAFYEKLGFKVFTGDATKNWLILKNGDLIVGLFQGMFEKNMLTFNPGWDSNAANLPEFTDIRELQRQLKGRVCRWSPKSTNRRPGRHPSWSWTLTATLCCSTSTGNCTSRRVTW